MKAKWSTETPIVEGWYWIQYKGSRRQTVKCPAAVIIMNMKEDKEPTTLVQSARNDSWIEGPNHGGPGLKYCGKLDKSIRFGPKIEEVE